MTARWVRLGSVLSGAIALAIALPATAQSNVRSTIHAPDYGSGTAAGMLSNSNFNSAESNGRPGVYFFNLGVQAVRDKDYDHAVEMYKVAASWAYKPAEYNLAIMYFKGEGVPADRPRSAAWMILAAERGDPHYVKARNLLVTLLSKEEFARTNELWNQLKQTYGDEVALARAKAEWIRTGREATGSHLGHSVGELRVGALEDGHSRQPAKTDAVTAAGFMQGGSADGSVAYGQFQQSSNPYDPIFLKNRTGTATVGPLSSVQSDSSKKKDQKTTEKQQPDQPLHNG